MVVNMPTPKGGYETRKFVQAQIEALRFKVDLYFKQERRLINLVARMPQHLAHIDARLAELKVKRKVLESVEVGLHHSYLNSIAGA